MSSFHSPWRPLVRARALAPPAVWPWLRDAASLTRRLQAICPGAFEVRVLSQQWTRPRLHEMRALRMRPGTRGLVRQVHLMCDGTPWVFARTVMPPQTLKGRQRRLAHLRARSLGTLLFADRTLKREAVEVAQLSATDPLYALAVSGREHAPIWGRRSLFRLRGRQLLVCEFFLPSLTARE